MTRLISFAVLFLINITLNAQGEYLPLDADYSFPRTIIERTEIPAVRARLSESPYFQLYSIVISTSSIEIPIDNSSNKNRKIRSNIARECAFIALLGKTIVNGNIVELSESDKLNYINKSITLLESLNEAVGFQSGWVFYWEWQLRSEELLHYLIAYDLLMGTDINPNLLINSKYKLQQFTGNLYSRTLDFYPNPVISSIALEFFSYNPNNHALRTCSALGIGAIVLNDATSVDSNYQPMNWMNSAVSNIDNALWKEDGIIPKLSNPNSPSGYAEGPNYFAYAFDLVMPFFRSMWNFLPDGEREYTFYDYGYFSGTYTPEIREIRHPWYDSKYADLYDWMMRIRMPDGRFPAIHDSSKDFRTMVTALSGNSKYNIPHHNSHDTYNGFNSRSQHISTLVGEGTYTKGLFQALPTSGSLIFRSSYNKPEGVYMHLIGKNGIALTGAKAHHQADATSFQIYYNKEDLALDPGYSGAPFRADVEKATDHNLILVNGRGPGTPNGEFVGAGNIAFIENFFDLRNIDYGEVRGAWQETNITRKTLFLNNKFFILADFVRSENINDYTFQLHGYGLLEGDALSPSGAFLPDFSNNKVTYSRNETNLLTHIESRGETVFSHQLDSLSLASLGYKEYSKTLVTENDISNTEFLSVLYPYTNGNPPLIEALELGESISSMKIIDDSSFSFVFVQPENDLVTIPALASTYSKDIHANGTINYISFDRMYNLQSVFIENGNQMKIGDEEYIQSSENIDFAIEYGLNQEISGFVSGACVLEIKSDSSLIAEYGNISNIEFDGNKSIITFADSSYFKLVKGDIISSIKQLAQNPITIKALPNPAHEFTMLHFNNNHKNMNGVISIYNSLGQLLFTENKEIPFGNNQFRIELPFQETLFFISLKTEVGTSVVKIFSY